MSESLVLCEGYHDRAFWAGWLTYLGCTDEGFRPGTKGYPAPDPWGGKVSGGKYAYHSKTGAFLRVVPCGGKTAILPEAHLRLTQRVSRTLVRLVINIDPDVPVSGAGAGATGLRRQDVLQAVRQLDSS